MPDLKEALKDALVCGSAASLTSTAALVACGAAKLGKPFAPTNAISHWYFGERATRRNRFTWRRTVFGYLAHHTASVFWALFYETLFGPRRARDGVRALGDAAAVAALAYFVDYRLTPRRLMPGYERRLSQPSLLAVYAAFAAGLALGDALLRITERRR